MRVVIIALALSIPTTSLRFLVARRRADRYAFRPSFAASRQLHGSLQNEAPTMAMTEDIYTVKVSYEGMSREIPILPNESILSAMERLNVAQEVGMPDLPSECRRGCCLSCSARHLDDSATSNLHQGSDGLNPRLSKEMSMDGFVLTCSSFVVGDGVHLSLAHNSEAWQAMHHLRLLSEETQAPGREAMARVIRKNAERHVEEWMQETEYVLKRDID